VKTPSQVTDAVRKRVVANWHLDIAEHSTTWPHEFTIGAVSKTALEADFVSFQNKAFEWLDWANAHGVELTKQPRRVQGTIQSLPTHVILPDLDTAVSLLEPEWGRRIQLGRDRLSALRRQFPDVADLPKVVRAVASYSPTDFDLLCSASMWFRYNSSRGLTPRQVPIEGLHAKWLNTHRPVIQILAGIESLGLLPRHPQRIHFTYLDPEHLAAGGRQHDSATVGDVMRPAYMPEIVVVSENKDTAIHFPPVPKAIAVEGAGFGGAEAIAAFDWLTAAPHLVYWGDLDPSGFEIVDCFRQAGLPVRTILMDLRTFEDYERFGASTDARGNPIGMPVRQNLLLLTDAERAVYDKLTAPEWTRVRRVEQERIPLTVAEAKVRERTAGMDNADKGTPKAPQLLVTEVKTLP
jgi:hypothetical protein